MPRYYHVIKRSEGWCLYADDALKEMLCDPEVRVAMRAARAAARRDGARVVLHKDPAAEAAREALASAPPKDGIAAQRPTFNRTVNRTLRRGRTGTLLPTVA